jgi:hypothetical protein
MYTIYGQNPEIFNDKARSMEFLQESLATADEGSGSLRKVGNQ